MKYSALVSAINVISVGNPYLKFSHASNRRPKYQSFMISSTIASVFGIPEPLKAPMRVDQERDGGSTIEIQNKSR